MNKTKKIITTLIFLMLFIILGMSKSNAANLYLNNLDFDAKINQDGSMNVTETWDISVKETNTLFKTFKTDQSKYSSITNVEVTEVTNNTEKKFQKIDELMYHVTRDCYYGLENEDGNFEIAWGVGLDDSRATKKYKISYKVNDVIAKYQDYAELYWQFVGSDFEVSADKVTGTIILPQNASSKDEIKVWGHTEGLNGEIYAKDLNKIEFEVNDFSAGRYIEIRTLFPTEMITNSERTYSKNRLNDVTQEETLWANQANERRKKKENARKFGTVGFIIVVAFIDVLLLKKSIKIRKEAGEIVKIKPSQELEYFREMPRKNATPAQAVFLYNETLTNVSTNQMGNIFSATLLDLSLKKYIEFEENPKDKKNIIIKILKKEAEESLENSEKVILEYIVGSAKNKDEITVKDIEKYMKKHSSNLIELKDDVEKASIREMTINGLYSEENATKKNECMGLMTLSFTMIMVVVFVIVGFLPFLLEYVNELVMIGGGLSLVALLIFTGVALSKKYRKISAYTQKGFDEKQIWKGLKKYMDDFSMLDKREIPEIVIWEQFLVYATAFGIADKVIKQLKEVYKELGKSFDFDSPSYGYMYFMTNNSFSSSFTNSMSSAFSTAYSSAYSSGSGSGGGFSGGGGGRTVDGGGGGGR